MLSVSDFNDFEVFAVVAAEGSLRRAAQRLGTSQPQVSQRITRLERNLGTTLMARSTSGVKLTDAGERLVPYLRRALHLMNEAIAAVKEMAPIPSLVVWTDTTLAPVVLPFVTHALQGVPVALSNAAASTEDTLAAVRDGEADVGFVMGDVLPPNFHVDPFFDDELCFVVHPDHELATRAVVSVDDVIGYDVAVTMCAPGGEVTASHLSVAGIPPERLRRVTPGATAVMLTLHDQHVGACLRSTVNTALDLGLLVQLDIKDLPSRKVKISCVTRSSDQESEPLQALRDAVAIAWTRQTIHV